MPLSFSTHIEITVDDDGRLFPLLTRLEPPSLSALLMVDKMADNVLLDANEPDGLINVDLLDTSLHTSFTADDDLITPVTLNNIFDHHLEDSTASPPRSPLRKMGDSSNVISLMKNDIIEEEWQSNARDLHHHKQILLQV